METKKYLIATQNRQFFTDNKRQKSSYDDETRVFLGTSIIELKVSCLRKLLPRCVGPLKTLKKGWCVNIKVSANI